MGDVLIRDARKEDFETVRDLLRGLQREHAKAEPTIFIDKDILDNEKYLTWLNGEKVILVAEIANEVVGVCHCYPVQSHEQYGLHPRKTLHIDDLVVSIAHRRKGIATELYLAAVEKAKVLEYDDIDLEVWEFNTGARELYEKLGMRCMYRKYKQDLSDF